MQCESVQSPTNNRKSSKYIFNIHFHMIGLDVEAGGFPNLEYNSTSSVEGVVYLITNNELQLLDSAMGYPQVTWSTA